MNPYINSEQIVSFYTLLFLFIGGGEQPLSKWKKAVTLQFTKAGK